MRRRREGAVKSPPALVGVCAPTGEKEKERERERERAEPKRDLYALK